MKTFVLFIFIFTGSVRGGVDISTQEFENEAACTNARHEFMKIMQQGYDEKRYVSDMRWASWCAPKGDIVN